MFWILFIGVFALSMWVSWRFRSKFQKYSQVPNPMGLTGAEIARQMLNEHGLEDVKVLSTPTMLGDHYNPIKKTVNLSPDVYSSRSVAAAGVAAHECGHALQHAFGYAPLKLRTALVPVQAASAKILNIVLLVSFLGGFIVFKMIPIQLVLLIIVATYSVLTLFSFVTLPVEFDASKRAVEWLKQRYQLDGPALTYTQDALKWAAMTYVVAALSSLVGLLYYLSLLMGRRD